MKIRLPQPQTLIWLLPIFVACSLTTYAQTPVYSFTVPTDGTGYDAVGNLKAYTDTVTGTWSMQYDNLNRLQTAGASTGPYTGVGVTWTYDSFGNRKDQSVSGTPGVPVNEYHARFDDASNRMTSNGSGTPPIYDAAGNLTFDGRYRLAYDAENRLCAVYDTVLTSNITQYLYDAEGHRVAKGHPAQATTTPVCTIGGSDFMPTEKYILGPDGEQITEFLTQPDGRDVWQHTNVYGNGQLIATYNQSGAQQLLHFNVTDPLGTKRIQTNAAGTPELNCLSLPFGDGPSCTGTGMEATEHRYTGKERDTESGNDYFGARYYASTMGRWMSPDPSGLALADITNPQSFNLYSYVLNNPLGFVDPDGLECVWDDGSFDSATDENTGSLAQCSKAGGTYVDPKAFSTLGAGDWSNKANSDIAAVANALNGSNNFTNVSVNANGSGYIDQTAMSLSGGIPYIVKNDYSWGGDTSLALATGVMGQGIPKVCAVGFAGNIGKYKVGASVSGRKVGGNVNGHSAGAESPQASGVDMRSASPLFKTVPVGVYLSPSDPSGNSVSSVSLDVNIKGRVGPVPVNVKGAAYVNLGTYTPNLSDSQNCP